MPEIGALAYEPHPPHFHWHLEPYESYELRRADDDTFVARDGKSGFCLLDRWGHALRRPGIVPGPPRFVGDCAALQPEARRVDEGSSVGYTDRYPGFFHGQDIDITGLQPGLYVLVHRANPRAADPGAPLHERRRLGADQDLPGEPGDGRSPGDDPPPLSLVRPLSGRLMPWNATTSSSSVPGRPDPRPRSTLPAAARASCSPIERASRATSRAAAVSPGGRSGRRRATSGRSSSASSTRFELRLDYRHSFRRTSTEPLILMTQRRRLDAYLVEQAVAAGASFRDNARVAQVEIGAHGVEATVGGEPVGANVLVGADGANGVVARAAGLDAGIVRGVALEGNVAWQLLDRDRYASTAVIEFGAPSGGYGWLFPKGEHANLGVGGWAGEAPRLRDHLARLARAYSVDPAALADVRGHRLPMRRRRGVDAGA